MWTAAIPDSDVTVNFGAGRAEMHVDNLALGDYTKVPISLGPNFQTAFVPATVSFDVVWSGPVTRMVSVTNGTNGNNYAGDYVENQVSVTWSGSEAGFSYTANPGNFSTSVPPFAAFAELGQEGNGSFAQEDSGGDVSGNGASLRIAQALGHQGKDLTEPPWFGSVASPTAALNNQPSSHGIGQTQRAATTGPVANRASAALRAHERLFELAANAAATLSTILSETGPHGEDMLLR
jgi:hypothetical protein